MTDLVEEDGVGLEPCEMMVIDVLDGQSSCDLDKLGYFRGTPFIGDFKYPNLQFIIESLKQYRQGNLEGIIMESQPEEIAELASQEENG